MKLGLYKTNLVGWWVVLSLMLCCACHHDYISYDVKQQDGIYMMLHDSLLFRFFEKDSILTDIEIHVLGLARDYDREIGIELVDSLTTAEEGMHYWLGDKVVLKAGELGVYVPLTFYRTRDPNFRGKRVTVGLQLKENENFHPVPGMGTKPFRAMIEGEIIKRPVWWNNDYLGPYAEVLYKSFKSQYESLETTNPSVYATINEYTMNWGNSITSPKVWTVYEYPMVKYVVHPLYDYYQANPNPEVNIPTPKY